MKSTAKTDYACLAMLELAGAWESPEPVRLRDISAKHDIPGQFLVQIMSQLKAAGLVASVRGATGGYRLAKSPDEITLGQVVEVFECPDDRLQGKRSASPARRVLDEIWQEVRETRCETLHRITLDELATRAAFEAEGMYYI